jgi:hypothetical protein
MGFLFSNGDVYQKFGIKLNFHKICVIFYKEIGWTKLNDLFGV